MTDEERQAAAVAQDNGDALRGVSSFVKHDVDKPTPHLLPFVALDEVSAVLAFGARKYRAHGWRTVDKRSRYLAATLRHLFAYARGEDRDRESGLRHLSHAACSLLFLLEADVSGLGIDDRPTRTP